VINAEKAEPLEGHYDLTAHGSEHFILDKAGQRIGAETAGKQILTNGDYSGEPIRALSCSVGACQNGFAQRLANFLKVEVKAPNDTIWAHPNGALTIGPTPGANTGSWVTFKPQ
jgi:hypothetical protein